MYYYCNNKDYIGSEISIGSENFRGLHLRNSINPVHVVDTIL